MEKYIGTIFTNQQSGFDKDIKQQAPNYVKYDPTKKLVKKQDVREPGFVQNGVFIGEIA